MHPRPTSAARFRPDIFSCLSLYRNAGHRDFRWTLALAALLGALYATCITPFAPDIMTYATAWAGTVDVNKSPYATTLFASPSLQITLPALLLKAGYNAWHVSLLVSAISTAVACAAIAAISYIFTRHVLLSLVITVLLLTYYFAPATGTAVSYPLGFFQFAQTGQYLALLAFALAAGGITRAAGIVGGALVAIDPVWGIAFLLGAVPVVAWLQPKRAERVCFSFALGALAALAMLHVSLGALPTPTPYQTPVQTPAAPAAAPRATAPPAAPFSLVTPRLVDAASPARAARLFFLPLVACAFISACLLLAQRRFPLCLNGSQARQLLLMVAIPSLVAVLLKTMQEADPALHLLTRIDLRLPALYAQALPLRWLNMATLLVPVVALGLLLTLARDAKSWVATLAFIALLTLSVHRWFFALPTALMSLTTLPTLLVLVCVLAYLIGLVKHIPRIPWPPEHTRATVLMFAILGFGGFHAMQWALRAHNQPRLSGVDATAPLTTRAAADAGPLLLAPFVQGAGNGFNPQMRTGRAVILPAALTVNDTHNAPMLRVYCHPDGATSAAAFHAGIRTCFENRTPREWARIAAGLPATGLITPQHWKLKLPKSISAGGFTYYRLGTPKPANG